ncbi:MAG: hypothetical protein J7502_05085 [Flavisolibacter sp.]|nr:hypothetical protein [Flavisolibacter sp.]
MFNSRKIEYRIIEFPIAAGYSIYSRNNIEAKIICELSFNYLLNAYYHPVTYAGQYKKQYWLGKSFSGLLSCNYSLNTNLKLSVEAGYSFMNETKKDIFLFSQDEPVIGIEHRYFPVLVGLNYTFR